MRDMPRRAIAADLLGWRRGRPMMGLVIAGWRVVGLLFLFGGGGSASEVGCRSFGLGRV